MNEKKFVRANHCPIGGVCGGIAKYFNIDPTFVRMGFVSLSFLWGVGIVLYIIVWVSSPEE